MNLFCVIPVENDATSFYRALQPLSQLRKLMPHLHLSYATRDVMMSQVAPMDVVFLQRPMTREQLNLMRICEDLKVKTWVDYDDNLFCVPKSNPEHSLFDQSETQTLLTQILKQADIVSVSTEQLALDLRAIDPEDHPSIVVIPNAWNDILLPETPVFRPHNVVMWRGTASHQQDLQRFSPSIVEAAMTHPKWLFNFMGYHPYFLNETLGCQVSYTPGMEILEYHRYLKKVYPSLCMVTLSDCAFNQCKSNIAWIEATYAGAVTLAPNWQEWRRPGVMTYNHPSEFGSLLQDLMSRSPTELSRFHRHSWEYMNEHLRLTKINPLRKALLEEVIG